MKNLTLIFNHFETEHFGKDVFLVPYYLGKIYNLDVTIVYPQTKTNKDFPKLLRGVNLKPIKNIFSRKPHSGLRILKELVFLFYVIREAKNIDILMRFFLADETVLIGAFYKFLNPNGFLYVKADGNLDRLFDNFSIISIKAPIKILKRQIYSFFFKSFNLITVEREAVYRSLPTTKILGSVIAPRIRLMNSGFDLEQFLQYDIGIFNFTEKENLIITVGRLGNRAKNTELLLDAIKRIDLKEWKIVLIGPIEKEERDFQKIIDGFFQNNPNFKDNVIFTGPIYDKKELWSWYNRAKIFTLPSISEGFSIVLGEALQFRNYIIATDVGGAGELIYKGYGEIIPQENELYLAKTLQRIINEKNMEKMYDDVDWNSIDNSWEKHIKDAFSDFIK